MDGIDGVESESASEGDGIDPWKVGNVGARDKGVVVVDMSDAGVLVPVDVHVVSVEGDDVGEPVGPVDAPVDMVAVRSVAECGNRSCGAEVPLSKGRRGERICVCAKCVMSKAEKQMKVCVRELKEMVGMDGIVRQSRGGSI